jgi:hypothetical protein
LVYSIDSATGCWFAAASRLVVPRIPEYTVGMDAKTRYRQRLKLQTALARVLHVLGDNAGIPPDKTTGKLAAQLAVWLVDFAVKARVELPNPSQARPDLTRYLHLMYSKRKETAARYNRTRKRQQRELEQRRKRERLDTEMAEFIAKRRANQ